jgi:hypothetical protein
MPTAAGGHAEPEPEPETTATLDANAADHTIPMRRHPD